MSLNHRPARLPPLPLLRVRRSVLKSKVQEAPCADLMLSMLSCWASGGLHGSTCAPMEAALRRCMDYPVPEKVARNHINFHLGRLQRRFLHPRSVTKGI